MSCRTIVVQRPSRPVEITKATRGTVVVRSPSETTVERQERSTVVVHDDRSVEVIHRIPRVVERNVPGTQGPPGAPGGSIPAIAFSFGDAPGAVWTPGSPGLLTYVRIIVATAFNGTSPAIIVGTLADPDAAMPANYNDPRLAREYENTPDIRLAAGESVILTITPGAGATAGAGTLLLEFLPD